MRKNKWTLAELEAKGIFNYDDLALVDGEPRYCCDECCKECDWDDEDDEDVAPCGLVARKWWAENVEVKDV